MAGITSTPTTSLTLIQQLFDDRAQLDRVLVAGACLLLLAVQDFLGGAHVGQRQFGLDDFDVVDRADLAGHVDDVRVFEAAHDVDDGVRLADVRQELVAQALALRRAGHEARDVDELDDGLDDTLRLDDGRQLVDARIRHLDDADVRLDGAERVVFSRDAGLGQGVEQGGLADVGQADDAAFETHGKLSGVEFTKPRIVPPLACKDRKQAANWPVYVA